MKAVIAFFLLLIVTLLSSCSSEPTPEPTAAPPAETAVPAADSSAPEPAATPKPKATPAPAPTAKPTERPTPTPDPAFSLDVTSDTTWGEVIDALAPQEQDCLQDNTDGVMLVELRYIAVIDDSQLVDEWRPALLYCLAPDTARALFLSTMLIASYVETLLTERGITRTEDHDLCLQEAVSDVDVGRIWIAKDDEAWMDADVRIFGCFPELVAESYLEWVTTEVDLNEEELGCVQEWAEDVDWGNSEESEDETWFMSILPGLADCSPDLILNLVLEETPGGIMLEELTDEELGCLREWVIALDWGSIPEGDAGGLAALASVDNLLLCVPLVLPTPEPPPLTASDSLIWQFPTEGWGVSRPAVVDGVVYFGSADHHVYALEAATGSLMWSFEAGGRIQSAPAVTDGAVYVGSYDEYLYALDRETGEPLWKHDTGDGVEYSPRFSNGIVYILSEPYKEGREIQAFDGTTGDMLWAAEMPYTKLPPEVIGSNVYVLSTGMFADEFHALDASTGERLWVLNIEDVEYPPVVTGGTVYFTGWDTAYAADEATGEILWSYNAKGGPTNSSVVVEEGVCYFAPEGYLHALDAMTGEVLWSYSDDDLIPLTPTVAEGLVFVGTFPFPRSGQFHALDAATGETVWSRGPLEEELEWLAVVDGVLYAEGQDGLLRTLQASSGEDLWELHHEGYLREDPSYTVAGGVVYLGSVGGGDYSGGMYAFTAPVAVD